jgi:predicted aspartyl protease
MTSRRQPSGKVSLGSGLVTECVLSSMGKTFRPLKALVDTGATGYGFIDECVAQEVCTALGIQPLLLSKPIPIGGYDGQLSKRLITHAIYPNLMTQDHTERTAPLLITTLGQHPIILGKTWLNTHGVIIDLRTDKLVFPPNRCNHDTHTLCFIPNDGIDYSVIRTEVQSFLGPEASVTRGKHPKVRCQGVFAAPH